MNAERTALTERARVHAALGDVARLAIVDALAAGDAAPGELGAALDLPTNLIAHHLKVLEDAGVVVRTRSEGDRRRTYVRLRAEPVTDLTRPSLAADGVGRVLFVCTQNSARSQLAAAIWSRRSPMPAACAGTEPATRVHPRAVKIARRHGLDPDRWRTSQLRDVVRHDDLLIAVCDNAYEHLEPDHRPRLHWSVADPARSGTDAAFETAYTELADRIDRLAPALAADSSRSKS